MFSLSGCHLLFVTFSCPISYQNNLTGVDKTKVAVYLFLLPLLIHPNPFHFLPLLHSLHNLRDSSNKNAHSRVSIWTWQSFYSLGMAWDPPKTHHYFLYSKSKPTQCDSYAPRPRKQTTHKDQSNPHLQGPHYSGILALNGWTLT